MAVIRWIAVVLLASVLMAIVQRFVPPDWPPWAASYPGMAVWWVVLILGIPILRQRFRGWRGVGAIAAGLLVALVASYVLYPVFHH